MFTKRQNEPHTPPRKPWAPMFQGGDGVLQTLCAGFDFLGVHHFTQYATVARTNEICPCSLAGLKHPSCKGKIARSNRGQGLHSEAPVIGEIKSLLSSRVSCVGSSPTASIYYRHVAKRTRHRSSKSIIGGSIPPVVNMLDSFISRTRSLHLREGGAVPSLSTNSLIAKRTRRFSPKEVNVGSTPTEAYAVEADRSMHRATNAEIAGSIPAGGFYDSVAQPGLELKAVNFRVAGSNPARVSIVESYNGITCGCYPHDRGSKPCSTANSLTGKHCGRSSIVEHLVVVQSTSARYRPITPMETIRLDEELLLKRSAGKTVVGASPYRFLQFARIAERYMQGHLKRLSSRFESEFAHQCSRGEIAATLVSRTSVYGRASATLAGSTISACGETAAALVLGTSAFGRVGATPTRRTNVSVI